MTALHSQTSKPIPSGFVNWKMEIWECRKAIELSLITISLIKCQIPKISALIFRNLLTSQVHILYFEVFYHIHLLSLPLSLSLLVSLFLCVYVWGICMYVFGCGWVGICMCVCMLGGHPCACACLVHVHMHTCHGTHVEVRGYLAELGIELMPSSLVANSFTH